MAMLAPARLRLDKFLWQARFFKSRTQATSYVAAGRLRADGSLTDKPHLAVQPGMVLTFPLGARIRVIKIVSLPMRRGPAAEARNLYEDLGR